LLKLILGKKIKLIIDGTILEEVKSFRLRKSKSRWFKFLVENFEVIGDKGYRGCEFVKVCESKEDKSIRQAVEGVNSQIKAFNYVSRCMLSVIASSEKAMCLGNFSPDVC